jgi:hypothetical protein
MKRVLLSVFLGFGAFTNAQTYVKQVYVLNEGYVDFQTNEIVHPVTLGSYNPQNQSYTVIDTIEGMRFASDAIIDGDFLYVAADTEILKYNTLTNQLVGSTSCQGVRNLAIYQDKLIATRGEYQVTYSSYLHIYDANTLQLLNVIDTVTGPKWATQNVVVDGTMAYIVVNNGYEWGNEKGIVGLLDLNSMTYGNEIDLGIDGKNPDNLVKYGNYLYTVNNKDWTGSSVSKIGLNGVLHATVNLSSASTGCGTSCLRGGKMVYQLSGDLVLNEFDVTTMNAGTQVPDISMNFYEIVEDQVNGLFYASNTDFYSYGKVYIYNELNQPVSSFDAGISPGTIVFDVRSANAGINELQLDFTVYPNPTEGKIAVNSDYEGVVKIINNVGQVVFETNVKAGNNTLDLGTFDSGMYQVEFNSGTCAAVKRITVY